MGEDSIEGGVPHVNTNKDSKQTPKLDRISESAIGRRSFDEHLKELEINVQDLKGRVLDIGSGTMEQFAEGAGKHGIEVVSVNPKLAFQADRTQRKHDLEQKRDNKIAEEPIAAIVQELPFKEGSFGTVISLNAAPTWLEPDDYGSAFGEIYRVLKTDGKAYLGPFDKKDYGVIEKALVGIGANYELVDTPESKEILKEHGKIGDWDHKYNIIITKQ